MEGGGARGSRGWGLGRLGELVQLQQQQVVALSIKYLHTICTISINYLHTIYILSTQEGARYNNDIALLRSSPEEELRFARRCTRASIWPACFPSPDIDYSFWFDTWVRDIT